MKRKAAFVLVTLLLATMVFTPAPASAATSYNWNGGSTGFWQTAGNWLPSGGPPNGLNGDSATISGSVVQLHGNYANSVTNLAINSGAELQTVVTSPNYNTSLVFRTNGANPTLTNNGTFRLSYTGLAGTITTASTLNISGSGSVLMESPAAQVTSDSNKTINNGSTTDHNPTIAGIGTINPAYLNNYGTVQAVANTHGSTLTMLATFNNYGILSASPGATLKFGVWNNSSSGLGFSYNGMTGGIIDLNGGNVNLWCLGNINKPDIRNSQSSSGSLELTTDLVGYNSAFFYGDTKLGSGVVFNINSNAALYTNPINNIPPVITNNGVINLKGSDPYEYSSCGASDGTLLTGSGRMVLNGNPNSQLNAYGSTGLAQDVNHTIEGGGTLSGKIVNNGTILSNNNDLTIMGNISGTGQVQVQDNGRLAVGKEYVSVGALATKNLLMSSGGAIRVDLSSTVSVAGNFSYAMTDTSKWFWDSDSTLQMSGSGAQQQFLEVGGKDYGLSSTGFNNNFNLPALTLKTGSGAYVNLVDNIDNGHRASPEALYVNSLIVPTGTTLNLNRLHLYTHLSGDIHQVQAGEGALFGGGQIINRPLKPITAPINGLLLDE